MLPLRNVALRFGISARVAAYYVLRLILPRQAYKHSFSHQTEVINKCTTSLVKHRLASHLSPLLCSADHLPLSATEATSSFPLCLLSSRVLHLATSSAFFNKQGAESSHSCRTVGLRHPDDTLQLQRLK